ncbi:alpha-amylase family glycosyl hydrolase, partial [Arachidicoccus sp.]|uniref:alpha-amylase family glycosyl hydrolase n=1 Tax=Arachidicoccus sp. TaxID=1872624 RepID=UPI003D1BCD30
NKITLNISFWLLLLCLGMMVGCSKKPSVPKPPPPTVDSAKKDVPSGAADGVTFINNGTSAIFDLYAPGKTSVYVIGDFNNWTASAAYKMTNSTDGTHWWVEVDNLDPTKEYAYQYYIDGSLYIADPYSHMILDKNNDKYIPASVYPNIPAFPAKANGAIVSVMQAQPTAYNWQATSFTRPNPKNLVVYELLIRDFVATHDYKTLTDTLDYIARLGVNAIELLPVNEFEGNDSWGYNTNFMFALDKYYGTPYNYKAFVDACHARGIAVIQDIVLEDQFGSSPLAQMYWNATTNTPTKNNPWLDSIMTHPYGVGYQLNYQKPATMNFAKNVLKYWVQQYHIDGYRFDQANGFTETNSNANGSLWTAYDAQRVQNLTTLNTYLKSIDPSLYLILEEFAEPKEVDALAKQGMISWNNQNSAGTQAAMGYAVGPVWDLSSMSYENFGITEPTGLMTYVESHDEVRVQFKNGQYGNSNGSYSIKTLATGLQRDAMLATFLFSVPGPKMMWMFGERGYDDATTGPDYDNLNGSANSKRLSDQPPLWNYMQDPDRVGLYNVYTKLIHYKIKNPVFTTSTFTTSLNGAVKWIQLLGEDGVNVEVIGNFDVVPQTVNITFPSIGTWYDNFGGPNLNVAMLTIPVTLAPGEYHVYSNNKLAE